MEFMRAGKTKKTIILLIALATSFVFTNTPSKAATKVPHFVLPSATEDKDIDIRAFTGKIVLINFFATWCPPCRQEIISLIDLQNEFGKKQFAVLGISMDTGGRRAKIVSKFVEKLGINYPVALADDKIDKDFGGIIGIPQSFLVDQEGHVVKSYPGYADHTVFKNDILSLLK